MSKKKVTELVREMLAGFLEENSLELYNTEYVKEGKDWYLRVYLDKPEGSEEEYVGTDECELVSRYLSDRLDEEDPIEQEYYLEVSSPGLDRELLKEEDYRRFAGRQVEISLYKAFEGKKSYAGELIGLADGVISIRDEKNNVIELQKEQVAKTRLAVIF
ncbi:MAG: ribosome maturation factor RimP [Clostridia bacterium]|nr:ribosome maturation factor RimP [Clostridia bacterium]